MSQPVSQTTTLGYFKWAFIVTIVGLVLGGWLGWNDSGTLSGMATVFFICAVLAVLEISLSFDNAIVNANKLKDMTPEWQHRYPDLGHSHRGLRHAHRLSAADRGDRRRHRPVDAIILAAARPDEYARIMNEAHLPIAAFRRHLLMMVGLSYSSSTTRRRSTGSSRSSGGCRKRQHQGDRDRLRADPDPRLLLDHSG